ncbi:MAG: sialidase family protein [Planctomycetota bacterium]
MASSIDRPKQPQAKDLPPGMKPDRSPLQLAEPVVVARGSIVPFGWVSAYDNGFLFVAYSFKEGASKLAAKTAYSDDGGQTWKPLPTPVSRNLDHGTARGCAIDRTGDGVAVSSGPGCAGLGSASPRQHLTKYTFTGTGWKAEFPTILDSDIRHCGSNASVVRLSSGPYRGRLWASWGQIGRAHRIDVHVKFSDDDGRTWIPWGRGAALPDSEAAQWSNGTYGYPETVITPYKDHVACFWRHKRGCGVLWSVYDGSRWSSPSEVSPVTLDRMDGAYRATMSAVTKGETEVFFTATGMGTVVRWDGNSWSAAPIECEDGGMLSLAGDVVTLFTAGSVNRRWKGIDWPRRTVLRYYRRSSDGRWEGPRDLTDEFEIHEYRSLPGFSVPPYAPANYVPLVWSDFHEGVVKLLKVPVTTDK